MSKTLANEITDYLTFEITALTQDVVDCTNEHAERLREKISKASPVNQKSKHPGEYRDNWKVDKAKLSYYKSSARVHNGKTHSLTHLLEYGHDYVDSGGNRVENAVKEYPHIEKNAEEEKKSWLEDVEKIARGN